MEGRDIGIIVGTVAAFLSVPFGLIYFCQPKRDESAGDGDDDVELNERPRASANGWVEDRGDGADGATHTLRE
ncbi:hypothetical protein F4778DRAFT_784975 [Xylariomycetidae sp. FL2044]|nr:hypothetical protein F4778DRAFT_784975 [Xylariomycetidae sp. FL2044]